MRQPPRLARDGNVRNRSTVRADLGHWWGLGVGAGIGCIQIDDVTEQDLAVVELIPPDDDGLEGEWALAESRDHGLAAGLDTLCNSNLAFARKELHRAHFAEIHAHRVVSSLSGFFCTGFGRNPPLLDFD